jgi:gliding motility-associated-like protein
MKLLAALIISVLHAITSMAYTGRAKDERFVPVASFTATTVCQGLPTVFSNNSTTATGAIVASIWDFGDGESSSVLNPQHVFNGSGIFSVTLTVINTQGDVDDVTNLVTVYPSGTLNFVIGSPNQCISSTFNFTNLSNIPTGSFNTITWDYGDASTSSGTNGSHHYAAHGSYQVKLSTTSDHNCANSITKTLDVYPEAAVDFSAVNSCQDKELPFTNTTSVASGLVSYQWSFGDATSSLEINPKHAYATPGDFDVNLRATTEKGCITNLVKQVTAHPVPVPDFAAAEPCLGSPTTFNNGTTIAFGTLSYTWDFGDGNHSTDASPDHLYAATGNYKVAVVATSVPGCKGTMEKYLHVIPKPKVNFSFKDVCFGQRAEFVNNTTIDEGDMTFNWTFGDGFSSNAINPTHQYDTYGGFSVNLEASAPGGGCATNLMKIININQQPKAKFESKNNCLDSLFKFKNTSVFTGTDITWAWEFGDGQTSPDKDPIHEYLSSQTYQVQLKAIADNGCTDSYFLPVKVTPLPLVNFIADNVCDETAVKFKNFTTIPSGTVTYVWEFDDDETSADPAPSHLYLLPGIYNVKVTAKSDAQCVTIKEQEVTVYPMPVTGFEAPAVCDSHPTIFNNTTTLASGDINTYTWDFGDASNSIVKSPLKEYLKEGIYVVKLTAASDHGCSKAVEKSITVFPPVIAAFSVGDVCTQEAIDIRNTSTTAQGSLTFNWTFGDNTNDIAAAPKHLYQTYGVYTVKLVATSTTGCKDSVSHPVAIFSQPQVDAGEDQVISQGFPAQLDAFGGEEYSWSPIEGLDNSNIADPKATPLETTTYTVTVTDKFGCSNTDDVTVTVSNDFKLMAANVMTPDGNGMNDTWVIENVDTFGDVRVRVYDRWGKLVFKQQAYKNDWAGISGSDALPDGTYYYFISFENSDKQYKGAITIMRNKK